MMPKIGKEVGDGAKGYIATYFEDDSQTVLSVTGSLRHRLIHQPPSSGSRATNPKIKIKIAKRTSSLTPEEKERSHRLETRLKWH